MVSEARLKRLAGKKPQAAPEREREFAPVISLTQYARDHHGEVPRHYIGVSHRHELSQWERGWPMLKGEPPRYPKAELVWLYDEQGAARKVWSAGGRLAGLYPACPICVRYHTDSENNPNACKGRPAVAIRVCPVAECGRPLYDTAAVGLGKRDLRKLNSIQALEERLRIKVENHVLAFHYQAAERLYGAQDISRADRAWRG